MKVLIAGATGYLGRYIVKELQAHQMDFLAIARDASKLEKEGLTATQIVEADMTQRASLAGICQGVEVVISTVGITRQSNGLSYMDVDYQANKNLLDEALKSGVRKFIYVSILNGRELTHLKICEAKERFVQALEAARIEHSIIRPSGFFSDLEAFFQMAQRGRVYLFGHAENLVNPIHGADLAAVCVDAIFRRDLEIEVGGVETYSYREIAELAFRTQGRPSRITHIPDGIRRLLLWLARVFLSKAQYGPIEFFLNVLVLDMSTKAYGHHRLSDFFKALSTQEQRTENNMSHPGVPG
ncbi:MAG: SDR family oxidoreductase [Bacteroidota bacterium]